MLSSTERVAATVDRALEEFRFDRAADALYHFVWGSFCDWYIELVKTDLYDDDAGGDSARAVLYHVLSRILRSLHPFMPFLTEELWSKLPGTEGFVAVAPWPAVDPARFDEQAEAEIALLQDVIAKIRNLRAESRIDAGRKIAVLVRTDDAGTANILEQESGRIAALTRADPVEIVARFDGDLVAARGVTRGCEIAIPLAGVLDLDAERTRLSRDLAKLDREIEGRARKLANRGFLDQAPPDIVEKERAIHAELVEKRDRVRASLATIGADRS
jgi:valyl-tRNA synthetase